MTIRQTDDCLSEEMLRQLAGNELPPAELQQIEQHVNDCPHCRKLLQAAENDSWWRNDVCSILKTADQLSFPAGDFDEMGPEVESLASILCLLGPSDDPQMMGRIGTYEIVGILGRGGMGVVFKASDAPLNRFVAIKMLLPHLAASGAARKRFAREGRAAAAVIDDNVMPIYNVAEWQGVPYLVTQYSGGVTLQKRIQQHGPLELKQILRIGLQTAKGLAAAHAQGLVHRDVKPSNILLDGTVERATLTDFGLARAVDDASITRTGIIAGTPQYMSPEQVHSGNVDARSDLFSLGSVLYAMCTGRPPFQADNSYAILRRITDEEPRPVHQINPEIPSWLCSIIAKLMSKQPDARYQTAEEVAQLLTDCLAHVQQPQTAPLPSTLAASASRTVSWFTSNPAKVIAMIGFCCTALILLAMLQLPDNKQKTPDHPGGDAERADGAKGTAKSGKAGQSVDSVNQEFLQRVQNEQKSVFRSLPFKVNDEGQVVDLSMHEFQLRPGDAVTISRMTRLTRLTLQGSNVSDDDLRHLARLTNLEELNLWHTGVGDAGVTSISGMTTLKSLQLGDTRITDAAVRELSKLTELRQLALARTKITDDGLKSLVGLKHLIGLKLSETQISDAGLKTLEALPALRGVTLDETAVTADGIAQFAKREGFEWMTTDEGVANEVARRQTAGKAGDVESMLGIGLELPVEGKFAMRSVTALPVTAKDTEGSRHRFRVEWDWVNNNKPEGLFAELAIRQRTARVIEAGVLQAARQKPQQGNAANPQNGEGDHTTVFIARPTPLSWKSSRYDSAQTGVTASWLTERPELLWELKLSAPVSGTAAIVGDTVYVPCETGELVCFRKGTGQRLWTYRSARDQNPKTFAPSFKSSPTVSADTVYLGDEDGVFHAIERGTGTVRWTFETQGQILGSAVLAKHHVIFGSYDKHVYCLNANDGSMDWKVGTEGYVHTTPSVIDGDVIVACCDGHLRVIDLDTGTQKHDWQLAGNLVTSPAIYENTAYVGTFDGQVLAVSIATGEIAWRYSPQDKGSVFLSSPAVTDQLVIIGCQDKRVHAIERKTGKSAWTFPTTGNVDSSPVVIRQRVYVGSDDGNLYELELMTGIQRHRFRIGDPISASPAIGEGVLVIGSTNHDGKVFCYGESVSDTISRNLRPLKAAEPKEGQTENNSGQNHELSEGLRPE